MHATRQQILCVPHVFNAKLVFTHRLYALLHQMGCVVLVQAVNIVLMDLQLRKLVLLVAIVLMHPNRWLATLVTMHLPGQQPKPCVQLVPFVPIHLFYQ